MCQCGGVRRDLARTLTVTLGWSDTVVRSTWLAACTISCHAVAAVVALCGLRAAALNAATVVTSERAPSSTSCRLSARTVAVPRKSCPCASEILRSQPLCAACADWKRRANDESAVRARIIAIWAARRDGTDVFWLGGRTRLGCRRSPPQRLFRPTEIEVGSGRILHAAL